LKGNKSIVLYPYHLSNRGSFLLLRTDKSIIHNVLNQLSNDAINN
ncbi:MAG: hypothetical protein ACI9JY_001759, partial [Saprospiraceae bacterium]